MSHQRTISKISTNKSSNATTSDGGARRRGQGRGHKNSNRSFRYTDDDTSYQEFDLNYRDYQLDNWESSTLNHNIDRGGSYRQNRGKNNFQKETKKNPGLFKFDKFSQTSKPDDVSGANTGNSDSKRLPKHASNPIFVHELVHRFSSILPESDLLEPEPNVLQLRGFQANQQSYASNVHSNHMPADNAVPGMNKSDDIESDYNYKENVGRYAVEKNSRYNQRESRWLYQSEEHYSIRPSCDSNLHDNSGAKRKPNKPHVNKNKISSISATNELSSEPEYVRHGRKPQFTTENQIKGTQNAYGKTDVVIEKPCNSSSMIKKLNESHAVIQKFTNNCDFRFSDENKSKYLPNDSSHRSSNMSSGDVTKFWNTPFAGTLDMHSDNNDLRLSALPRSEGISNDQCTVNINNKIGKPNSGNSKLLIKDSLPQTFSVNEREDKKVTPNSNRKGRLVPPNPQERLQILREYGFDIPNSNQTSVEAASTSSSQSHEEFQSKSNKNTVVDINPPKCKPIDNTDETKQTMKYTTNTSTFLSQRLCSPSTSKYCGTQFSADLERPQPGSNKPVNVINPHKDGSVNNSTNAIMETNNQPIQNSPNVPTSYPHQSFSGSSNSCLGSKFLADLDQFESSLNNLVPDLENSKGKVGSAKKSPSATVIPSKQTFIPNHNKGKDSTITSANSNQPSQMTSSVDLPRENQKHFVASGTSSGEGNKLLSLNQTNTHPIQFRPSCSMVTCEELELMSRGVSGAGPFNIVRTLADFNETPVRRYEALANIEKDYEVKRKEHEQKEKEKLEKKRQEKLRRYSYVDNGHGGYRMNEGFLDEASGFAPEPALQSEDKARDRQQLQLKRDAIIFKERQEKEEETKRKKEEEKLKNKLEKNKHISTGYKLGSGPAPGFRILQTVNTVERQENNNNSQQIFSEAHVLKDIKHQNQTQHVKKSIFVEAESTQRCELTPAADGGGEKALSSDEDILAEEERLRQEAIYFQELARMAEERLRELNKQRNKHSETKKYTEVCSNTPCNSSGSTENSVLKLRQTSLEPFFAEALDTKKTEIKYQAELIEQTAPSCVLKNKKSGPVLVLRPSAAALQRAVAARIELQDEFDKSGHSDLYTPNIHPIPEFANNRFESCLTSSNVVKSTGAIPKQRLKPQIEKPQEIKIPSPSSSAYKSAEEDNERELPEMIDHAAEMRAARLRMQLKYEKHLQKQTQQNKDN